MNKNITKLLLSAALLLCCFAAIAAGTQPSAGDGSQDNPYLLTNYADLQWFAAQVNGGQNGICAKLTADITVNAGVLDSNGNLNGTPSNTWTPIGGQNGRDYSGEFDGNGHTISGLYFNDENVNNIGLFGKAVGSASIHDLGIKDSYFCGKDHVGGICGDFASGRIENCWSEVTVYVATGDGGGLTGSVYINAVLTNCYSICNVSGNGSRGLVCGAFYGTIENCYAQNRNSTGTTSLIGWTSGEGPHTATNVEIKDAAAFASGEVCWLLNNGVTDGTQKWYQTLGGTDNFPVLDNSHGTVYYGYDGNVLTYSNSPLVDPSNKASYIDANGNLQVADNVTEITNSSSTLNAGWYVVTGADVQTGSLTCNGAVNLILADGAKLTATGGGNQAGITVLGDGNSLTIYGQAAQSGQLFAKGGNNGAGIGGGSEQSGTNITIYGGTVTAASGDWASAIGGGFKGNGSNITINGGTVKATAGKESAGIGGGQYGSGSHITINGGTVTTTGGGNAAGIGGGDKGSGFNIAINGGIITATGGVWASAIGGGNDGGGHDIIINGGEVTANGGENAAGIGRGNGGSASNIKVAAALTVYADNNNPPMVEIPHTSDYDIAPNLAGKRYAVVKDDITDIKQAAIAAINAAIEGVTNADIIAIATNAINAINAATSVETINALKEQALAAIAAALAAYNSAFGEMGVPCDDCPAVDVTKGDKTIKLYNPEKVEFRKME